MTEISSDSNQRQPEPGDAARSDPPTATDGITPEEVQAVLLDEGYSADHRKAWLKQLLTELTVEPRRAQSRDRRELAARIRRVLAENEQLGVFAEDVLGK